MVPQQAYSDNETPPPQEIVQPIVNPHLKHHVLILDFGS